MKIVDRLFMSDDNIIDTIINSTAIVTLKQFFCYMELEYVNADTNIFLVKCTRATAFPFNGDKCYTPSCEYSTEYYTFIIFNKVDHIHHKFTTLYNVIDFIQHQLPSISRTHLNLMTPLLFKFL